MPLCSFVIREGEAAFLQRVTLVRMEARGFAGWSHRKQIETLRAHAHAFLGAFGLPGRRLRLVNHGFNTTFAVLGKQGPEFALRLNVNSKRTPEELRAETQLVHHLFTQSTVQVAEPQPSLSGENVVFRDWAGTERPIAAVLYQWLPGRNVGDRVTPATARTLGQQMGELHRSLKNFHFSPGARLSVPKDVLFGQPNVMDAERFGISGEAIEGSLARVGETFTRLKAANAQPIHFDLHFSNVRWVQGRMAVIDFDDTVLANPLLDPAQTLYYVRSLPGHERLEEAFWDGLGWTPESQADLEDLVAARQLLLCNDAISMVNADWEDWVPRYVKVSARRLELYLETGRFVTTPGTALGFTE